MSCKHNCRKAGIACPTPTTCAASTLLHVRNGGQAIDTDFGHSRMLEQPRPTAPLEELDDWSAKFSRRAVLFVLAVAAGAFAIGFFSR